MRPKSQFSGQNQESDPPSPAKLGIFPGGPDRSARWPADMSETKLISAGQRAERSGPPGKIPSLAGDGGSLSWFWPENCDFGRIEAGRPSHGPLLTVF